MSYNKPNIYSFKNKTKRHFGYLDGGVCLSLKDFT